MSLVDIPHLPTEDKIMDPAIKDYVDTKLESSEARSATLVAEFRTLVTATLVRMEERDAARQRADDIQHKEVQRQLDEFRKESRGTRKVIIATGVTATLTILSAQPASTPQSSRTSITRLKLASATPPCNTKWRSKIRSPARFLCRWMRALPRSRNRSSTRNAERHSCPTGRHAESRRPAGTIALGGLLRNAQRVVAGAAIRVHGDPVISQSGAVADRFSRRRAGR